MLSTLSLLKDRILDYQDEVFSDLNLMYDAVHFLERSVSSGLASI